jgi:hypothetical protein
VSEKTIEVAYPGIENTIRIRENQLERYKARGWTPVTDDPQDDPEAADGDAASLNKATAATEQATAKKPGKRASSRTKEK